MSVFDALGAAATILQFIEYGIKFGNKVVAAYKSRSECAELRQLIRDYQQKNESFNENLRLRSSSPSSGEVVLIKIAEDCHQTATDLVDMLGGFILKDEDKSRFNALKIVAKGEWKKKDIQAKQTQLEVLRQQCHEQLSVVISDQQYALANTLSRIERDQQRYFSAAGRQLAQLKTELVADVTNITASHSAFVASKLVAALKVAKFDLPQESILSSLQFPDMRNRQDTISEPSHSTYNWIFETACTLQHPVQYTSWLESGDGIFWVTGKAGSGKSTLMKHISTDTRTAVALEQWANGRKLLTASHYFWYLGSPMEKSYSGLIRSILYKIFDICPNLIQPVCSSRWSEALQGKDVRSVPWSDMELQKCLETLVTSDLKVEGRDPCFCFFIDGLDEYDGDREVIRLLARLASTGRTKICASSRPWNKFETAFRASKERGTFLELHLHTREDIAKVVEGELSAMLIDVNRASGDWGLLVQHVIERAEGVFLWVTLVLKKELIPCLGNYDDFEFVMTRLDAVPSDLDEYFQHIFERIWADDKYRSQTAKIFKSCMAASSPLPMAAVQVMIHDRPDKLATTAPIERNYTWDHEQEIEVTKARVNSRCQDLLAAVAPGANKLKQEERTTPKELYRIEFLHRSVRDFLKESKAVQSRLDEYAGHTVFDAHFTLTACYVFLVKRASKFDRSYHRHFRIIATDWCIEALFHMGSVPEIFAPSTLKLLSALDKDMQLLHASLSACHWSNYLVEDPESYSETVHRHDLDVIERGNRDLLGHLIEIGLTCQVETLLKSDPSLLQAKEGRPYLDYALRRELNAPFRSKHPEQARATYAMVELLLKLGCGVNEVVEMHGNRTIWDSYLYYIHDQCMNTERDLKTTWLLISNGAGQTGNRAVSPRGEHDDTRTMLRSHDSAYPLLSAGWTKALSTANMTNGLRGLVGSNFVPQNALRQHDAVVAGKVLVVSMEEMLTELFGANEAKAMQLSILQNGKEKSWAEKLSWLGMWLPTTGEVTQYTWVTWENAYANMDPEHGLPVLSPISPINMQASEAPSGDNRESELESIVKEWDAELLA